MLAFLPFLKSAGKKLFGVDKSSNTEKSEKLKEHLLSYGFSLDNVSILVDDDKVTLSGEVATQAEEQKLLVAAGNIKGIKEVEDKLNVKEQVIVEIQPKESFYTVQKGDYLSKIAKKVYGDAKKYTEIFEANKPMLKHPDKIYPGQVLVIPPKTIV